MQFVCDAPNSRTWFRIETEAEAQAESDAMKHAVEKYFRREQEKAAAAFQPPPGQPFIERDIGLKAHIARSMALFLTLRDSEGAPLATAMLPAEGKEDAAFRIIIVGPANVDPYPEQGEAIAALGKHFNLTLDREHCFPYQR
jgi:hypothetical protein